MEISLRTVRSYSEGNTKLVERVVKRERERHKERKKGERERAGEKE